MLELRRIRAGIFTEDNKKYPPVNLYDFEKAVDEYKNGNDEKLRKMIIPAELISEVYSPVEVKKDSVKNLMTGKPLIKEYLIGKNNFESDEIVSIFCDKRFIGMYKVINDGEIIAKAEFVMQEIKWDNLCIFQKMRQHPEILAI